MTVCHCGSSRPFDECCGPVLSGERAAATAEALMRARYSAYVEKNLEFLQNSLHPQHRDDWDPASTARWAEGSQWLGLEIRSVRDGQTGDAEGTVEFIADYKAQGQRRRHHEVGRFALVDGRWYYVDGQLPKPETVRNEPKVGRNDPCPCGSGRKYKKCCGK